MWNVIVYFHFFGPAMVPMQIRIRVQHFRSMRIRDFDDQKLGKKFTDEKNWYACDQKLLFTYPEASIKKRTSSTSKLEIQNSKILPLFFIFVGHICPPGSGSIRYGSGSETLFISYSLEANQNSRNNWRQPSTQSEFVTQEWSPMVIPDYFQWFSVLEKRQPRLVTNYVPQILYVMWIFHNF